MFCTQCGNKIIIGDRFCSSCGKRVRPNEERENESVVSESADDDATLEEKYTNTEEEIREEDANKTAHSSSSLVEVSEYSDRSNLTVDQVIAMINHGDLVGEKRGNTWFVQSTQEDGQFVEAAEFTRRNRISVDRAIAMLENDELPGLFDGENWFVDCDRDHRILKMGTKTGTQPYQNADKPEKRDHDSSPTDSETKSEKVEGIHLSGEEDQLGKLLRCPKCNSANVVSRLLTGDFELEKPRMKEKIGCFAVDLSDQYC